MLFIKCLDQSSAQSRWSVNGSHSPPAHLLSSCPYFGTHSHPCPCHDASVCTAAPLPFFPLGTFCNWHYAILQLEQCHSPWPVWKRFWLCLPFVYLSMQGGRPSRKGCREEVALAPWWCGIWDTEHDLRPGCLLLFWPLKFFLTLDTQVPSYP